MKLFHTFIFRPLWRDKLRTLLSVTAVALGIAAVVAIQLANRSAIASFQESVTRITGRANLSITGAAPFNEELLSRGYEAFAGRQWEIELSPVVEGVAVEAESREALDVLAVDLATDRAVRDTAVEGIESVRDMLLLLTDPASVLLGRAFASRHRLRPGDDVALVVNDRRLTFRVRGILSETGPGAAMSGNIAVMDIAAGQLLFGRLGRLDRIDLVIPPDQLGDARRRLASWLPEGVRVERPRVRSEQVEKMLRAFRLNLSVLSLVSLIVGAFLIYNTVAISVVRRRAEVGALRALGASRLRVLWLFLAEALLLGASGAALGIALGRLLAGKALSLVAGTVNSFWFLVVPAPIAMDWPLALVALGIGAGIALLSAVLPAREAAEVEPAEALRRGAHEHARRLRRNRDAVWGVVAVFLAYGAARLPAVDSRPVFGYAAAVLLVAGFALLMPLAMTGFARVASAALGWLGNVAGLLAARSLVASLGRASVLAMALATAIAMMASVAIMVTSFRRTVDLWAAQTFRADLFIRPAGASGGRVQRATIGPGTIQAIAATAGVAAVDAFRTLEIAFSGNPAFVACGDWEVLRRHGNLMFLDGRRASDVLRREPGMVVVSEPFALGNGVKQGDSIFLPTPAGDRPFRVAGVYYDYTSDRGYAVMDRSDWLRYGGDSDATSLAVYLQPGANAERVRQALFQRTAGRALLITLNRELKANVMRIFDRTFAITWVLEVIAICVAILGIANALLALVLERRRELGILRYLGASGRQLRRLVVIEAALLGLLACAAGLLLGFGLSLVLIYVINRQSFGWTIQFSLPGEFLALATLVIYIATCLSALYPARQAARIDPVEAVLVE